MKHKINELCRDVVSSLLGHLGCCDLCGENVGKTSLLGTPLKQHILCQYCINDLPYFKQLAINGNLLSWPAVHRALPNIEFDYLFALAPYIHPFDHWLAQFKYSGRFELAKLFSVLLVTQWKAWAETNNTSPIDVIVPVPLHVKKWQSRGYNQAHLIARTISTQLNLPYKADLVKRVKHSDSQMGKTGSQRRASLAGAFVVDKDILENSTHVLLVDDVVTTGTTASEISKKLKQAGITNVTVMAVCLTLPKVANKKTIST